jgi:hypothetical protein
MAKAVIKTKKLRVTLKLNVTLTEAERMMAAMKMADLMDQESRCVLEGKAVAKSFKGRADEINGQISQQQLRVRNGYELRDVECEEFWDLEAGFVRITRLDTGEQVSERAMTAEERQGKLFVEVEVKDSAPVTSGLEGSK